MKDISKAYFIGIGGIGMSALARFLLTKGVTVFGYDRTETPLTKKLVSNGIEITYDDNVKYIPDEVDVVIYTPAIPSSNNIFTYFVESDIAVYKRSEFLKIALQDNKVIAVAGTHGKTSTSAVLSHILYDSFLKPSCFVGGIMNEYQSNFLAGSGEWTVVEADEYDRSFLRLFPQMAIIQALDPDHLDIYGSPRKMVASYKKFTSQIATGGKLIAPFKVTRRIRSSRVWFKVLDDKGVQLIGYGLKLKNNRSKVYINDVVVESMKFNNLNTELKINADQNASLKVPFPGKHNALNTVSAAICARLLGLEWSYIVKKVSSFQGIKRRFDVIYHTDTQTFIDDYAHHPEEIRALLNSVRKYFSDQKITGIFQPHLYSRTDDFKVEFARELDKLDEVILLPIYPARELPKEGVSSKSIFDLMKNKNKIILEKNELIEHLKINRPKVLLTIGAGDIDRLVPLIENEIFTKNKELTIVI